VVEEEYVPFDNKGNPQVEEKPKTEEIATQQDKMVVQEAPDIVDIEKKLAMVEKTFQLFDKLKEFALKNISANNIIDESGKPYIMENGVTTFRAPFGIYEQDVVTTIIKEDGTQVSEDDPNAFKGTLKAVRCKGIIGSKMLGIKVEFEAGVYLDEKQTKFKSADDFIWYMKKARSNFSGRGIRKLLSIDNITWADLEKHGIRKEDCAGTNRAAAAPPTEDELEQRKKVGTWIVDMHGKNNAEDKLEEYTQFTGKDGTLVPGIRKLANLSGKRLAVTYGKIKKDYEEFSPNKTEGDPGPTPPAG